MSGLTPILILLQSKICGGFNHMTSAIHYVLFFQETKMMEELKDSTLRLILPIDFDGHISNYTFTFKINDVIE